MISRHKPPSMFVIISQGLCLKTLYCAICDYIMVLYGYTVETHLAITSLRRPPFLKTPFGPERNISLYLMFNVASLIRPVSL